MSSTDEQPDVSDPAAVIRRHLRLMVLTDRGLARGRTDQEVCRQALRGGATAVQLRCKTAGDAELLATARALAPLAARAHAWLVVNDRPDVARLAGAAACHLGPDDLEPAAARRVVGADIALGCSAGSAEEARMAARSGVDYLGVGPIFETRTKADAGEPLGPDGLAAVVAATSLPVIAIGGIDAERVALCIGAGACGVAVISAAVGAASLAPAVRGLRRAVDAALAARR